LRKLLTSLGLGFILLLSTPALASDQAQIECLARNAYFEARGEGTRGMTAVTHVVINRTKDRRGRWGTTPCQVINQRHGNRCQFSWVCRPQRITDQKTYARVRDLVTQVYRGAISDTTGGATFFRHIRLSGLWGNMTRTATIGQHAFFRG
jgi:spore germination cell wall hydrolase CwlJ-like protein